MIYIKRSRQGIDFKQRCSTVRCKFSRTVLWHFYTTVRILDSVKIEAGEYCGPFQLNFFKFMQAELNKAVSCIQNEHN